MKYIFVLCLLLLSVSLFAQSSIKGKSLARNIDYLASDQLSGRWPGSQGDSAARKFIIEKFEQSSIKPLGSEYQQLFDVTLKLEAPAAFNYLKTANDSTFLLNKEYGIFPFSGSGTVSAPVIIAENYSVGLNALKRFPNCWLLVWRRKNGAPASDSLSDHALAAKAIQHNAAGVVFVTPDSVDKKDVLTRLRPRKDEILTAPVIQLKRLASRKLLDGLRNERLIINGSDSFYVSGQPLSAAVKVEAVKVVAANIVGIIEGSDPQLKKEYIVLGAHYDHLGYGGYGTGSLKPDTTAIHNGADDNASGTSALIEIAKTLSRKKATLKRSVMIVAFAAEEEGLLGSQYFAAHLPVPDSSVKVMLNMDMVGRLNAEQQLYMGGAGTFPGGVEFMKSLEKGSGLKPVVHAGGVGGSDHVSFYRKGISCIGFHTGGHPQYHTPADDASLINVKGMEKVARYIYRAVVGLSNWNQEFHFVKQD